MAEVPSDPCSSNGLAAPACSKTVDNQSAVASAPLAMKKADDFIFCSMLGEGSFSTVYYAREVDTEREFAIKVCNKHHIRKEKKVEYVKREKDVMVLLANRYHPFFVRLYCTFHDDARLYFVMSLAKNGELLDFLRKLGSFDNEVTRFYAAEIIVALEHLHDVGVIHRDLKPENVLLTDKMHIMISDFGSALILGAQDVINASRPTPLLPMAAKKRSSFVGTAQYLSPEVLNGLPAGPRNEYMVFQKITKLDFTFPPGFPDVPKDFVQKLLIVDPVERLSVEAIRGHPFFAGVDWASLPDQHPPDILPYLPATGDQPAFHSDYKVPENIRPGLDDKQMTRLLGLQLADTRPAPAGYPALFARHRRPAGLS